MSLCLKFTKGAFKHAIYHKIAKYQRKKMLENVKIYLYFFPFHESTLVEQTVVKCQTFKTEFCFKESFSQSLMNVAPH